jgi:hypothetical protein
MTQHRKEVIAAYGVLVGALGHYGFGYFFWDRFPALNLYYITVYFNLDLYGFVIYLLAKDNSFLKLCSMMAMMMGSYFLFMEFNNPSRWNAVNYITLILLMVNTFFLWHFLDKLKNNG